MLKKNVLIICLSVIGLPGFTQAKDTTIQDRKEYIRTQKIAFISTQVELTAEEAEKFWPIYNEYEAKTEAIRKEKRDYLKELKNFEELTDDRAYELTEKVLDAEKRETELRSEYLAKFADVLGKKKAAKVFMAEERFKRELLRQIQGHDKHHDRTPPRN